MMWTVLKLSTHKPFPESAFYSSFVTVKYKGGIL